MTDAVKVLIIEDLPTDAELAMREVRQVLPGAQFLRVETREDFLAALAAFFPDLIIADFKLSGFDGLAALKLARERAPELPFIIVTGSMNEDTAVECMKAGAWDYVIKEHIKRLGPAVLNGLQQKELRRERRTAEDRLRESEERFRLLFEHSMDAIILGSPDGGILSANPAACRMLGRTEAELRALGRGGVVDSSDPRLPGLLEERTRTGRAFGELTFFRKDGTTFPGEVSSILFQDAAGSARSSIIIRDITARKQAECEIAESESRFRKLSQEFHGLLDAIPDNLTLQSPDLKVIWANKGAADGLGKKPEEMVGLHCYAMWHGRTEACEPCPVLECFATGRPAELIVTTPDNRIWDLRTIPLRDEQGKVVNVIEVGRNITEHRRLEAQYLQAQKMEAIGHLAGGVAHDFNNILSAIIGFGHLALMKLPEDEPLRLEIESMLEGADRAAYLTKELLLFSRKQVSERKPLDLNDVLRKVEKFLRRVIGEDIECRTLLSGEPLPVLADGHQLEQVLMNLATNARDAMPGGGTLTVAAEQVVMQEEFIEVHGYGKPGAYALLTVSDTGKGMDDETRRRLFEPFFTTKEVGKGTGLGLAVVYGIIKQHDGFINIYSEPGHGSLFRIYLPLHASPADLEGPAQPQEPLPRGSETVLVAEDDEALRKLTQIVLTNFGYQVIEAKDGEDAVRQFRRHRKDVRLVLLDLIMPRMNGKEAADEIRRTAPEVKILFTTGYAPDHVQRKVRMDKESRIIQKPIVPADLLRKVRNILDGAE